MRLLSKTYKSFKDISIKHKLFTCIIIFMLFPLLITYFYINIRFKDITVNSAAQVNFQILKQTSRNLEQIITDTEDLSVRILSNVNVQRIGRESYDNAIEFDKISSEISNWLDDAIGSKPYYDLICLSKNNNFLFQKGKMIYDEEVEYVEKAIELKGSGFWTETYNLKSYAVNKDYPVVSFYRAINDFKLLGRIIAVASITINEEIISNSYKKVNPYEGGQVFLVDSTGEVLSSTDKKLIGKQYMSLEYVKNALQGEEGFFFTSINKQKNAILFYTFKETGWVLIETIPERSLVPLGTTINIVIVIAIIVCLIFGVLFSLVQTNFIIKPLNKLLNEMNKIRKGNFNVVLEIESKDEIGQLSSNFMQMSQRLNQTINEVYISKIKQRESELIALESQINPHFLYNTLDSIHWLAIKNKDYDVSEQIEALSEIFKHVLSKGKEIVTIRNEIEFLNNYMFIQKSKYGDRINLFINIEEELKNYKALKLILQPLVENSILHGLEQKLEGGNIWITIEKNDNFIRYIVSDDGMGVNEERINEMFNNKEQSHNVFALKNIDERIKLKFGQEYGLSFHSKENEGTVVEVTMPIIK